MFELLLVSVVVLLLNIAELGRAQSCSDVNVFCVDLAVSHYASIDAAYTECAVTQSRTDCVIMIEGPVTLSESLLVTHSMDNTTRGLIIPYNGDVVWERAGVILEIQANYWTLRGNEGFSITVKETSSVVALQINTLSLGFITIGPNVTFESSASAAAAIDFVGTNNQEGIIATGVTFGTGNGSFLYGIGFLQNNKALPSDSDYRLTVKNCRFMNIRSIALVVQDSWGILFDSNYILLNQPNVVGVYLAGSSYGEYQNNIFEVSSSGSIYSFFWFQDGSGSGYQSLQNQIRGNTFICGDSLPDNGAFWMNYGGADTDLSPKQNHFTNLLFHGSCAETSSNRLFRHNGCGDTCLGNDTTLTCIRSTDSMSYHSQSITEDHSCPGDGNGVSIKFREYYELQESYIGVNITGLVPLDYFGRRRHTTNTSMGAIEYQWTEAQSCFDVNVFCVDLATSHYATINAAYTECAVTQSRTDCVIKIEGPVTLSESLLVTHSMDSTTRGLFIPYNGDVVWEMAAVILQIQANCWTLRGNEGFNITMKVTSAGGVALWINTLSLGFITIGPNVTFESSASASRAIYVDGDNQEGIIVNDVTFGTGSGTFDFGISFWQTNKALPSGSDYRLAVKNCRFINIQSYALFIATSWGILFDSNYILFNQPDAYGVYLAGSSYGEYQNNIFEVALTSGSIDSFFAFGASPTVSSGYQSLQNQIRANTFICGDSLPDRGVFYMSYTGTATDLSPKQNHFTNLLFHGSCAGMIGNALFRHTGCGDVCLGNDTTLTCIRSTTPMSYHNESITEDHSCPGDGNGVSIEFREVGGDKPFPYYEPLYHYIGVNLTGDVPLDYVGRQRKENSALGAIGWTTPLCNGIPADQPGVCSGNGVCVSFDICNCSHYYIGSTCELPICNDIPAGDPSVCGGNGECVDSDTCLCNDTQTGQFCDNQAPLDPTTPDDGLSVGSIVGIIIGGLASLLLPVVVVVVICVAARICQLNKKKKLSVRDNIELSPVQRGETDKADQSSSSDDGTAEEKKVEGVQVESTEASAVKLKE